MKFQPMLQRVFSILLDENRFSTTFRSSKTEFFFFLFDENEISAYATACVFDSTLQKRFFSRKKT